MSISSLSRIAHLAERYTSIRDFTGRIASPLSAEDCMIQSMPDASPTRWHMAHTTWFFETFILGSSPKYKVFDERFKYLFNSYYNSVGSQFPRAERGMISRPGMQETLSYRRHVDEAMRAFLESDPFDERLIDTIEIGLNHEQQHQELMQTDIKHALSCNPTLPVYEPGTITPGTNHSVGWQSFREGVFKVGHRGGSFGFDNEFPRHRVFLPDYSIASRCVTAGEFIDFINDGGYTRPDHWLSMGWNSVQSDGWCAPMYWVKQDGQWMVFSMAGLVPVDLHWPVCHISYFEADAFARWAGYRLPTEFEWEHACESAHAGEEKFGGLDGSPQFADRLMASGHAIHPTGGNPAKNLLGGVWEWTSSSYAAYPGYAAPDGALGEYNGKFMCNQYVLRGGSVASSASHIRATYRNFFAPDARWQFSGFRLAK